MMKDVNYHINLFDESSLPRRRIFPFHLAKKGEVKFPIQTLKEKRIPLEGLSS